MRWLDAFKECFGHRAQELALRRYVQGLLSDSARKSMEAMLARVTDPGSYQAFQHFITDSPWSADRVWRRLRVLLPEREGLLIFDGTSFPKAGDALGRGGAPVLWRVGEGRQLSGGRDRRPLDRGPRVPAGRGALPAGGVADRRRPRAGADSRRGALSGEVAPGADVAAASPREWDHHHRAWRRMRNLATTACFGPCCTGCGRMPWGSRRRRPSLWGGPASCGGCAAGWGARAPARTWPRACGPPRLPPRPRRSGGGGASVGATAAQAGAGRSSVWPCG